MYYAVKRGCADSIEAVPLAGGAPRPVAAGSLVRQVAIGYLNRDHTSLDASGGWLLYLSAPDLFVADGTARAGLPNQ